MDRELTRRRLLAMLGYGGLGLIGARLLGGADPAVAAPPAALETRLTREWGLEYPIVGAGMGFYALPELVAAISNAGALGVLGAAAEPPPRVLALIRDIKARTSRPFGVDFVHTALFGAGVPAVTDTHIDVCVSERVPLVVFFWNPPEVRWVQRLHAAGAKVWMQVASVAGARGALARGVDALIAQGAESGGHLRGVAEGNPLPRSELVPRLVAAAGGRMVLAAGGITNGEGLADALHEGAAGAWVGTRFATSLESYAHDEYKRRVVAATHKDTAQTTMFGPEWPGAPARAIRNRVVDEWAGREDQIPVPPPPPPIIGTTIFAGAPYAMPKFSAILPTRDTRGDFEEMWFAAGSVSAHQVNDIKPAAQIIAEMGTEARAIIERWVVSGG